MTTIAKPTAVISSELPLSRLLFASLGPPAAWAAHLLVNYFLASAVCWTGSSWIMLVVHLVTLVTLVVALGAGVIAWRTWQNVGHARETTSNDGRGIGAFVGLWGISASAIFALLIVVGGFAGYFLSPCQSV
jgi:hypothetical protein